VHNSHSRSSKVVDFGTNRKGTCDLLLVINSNLGPDLAPFLRYSDLLAENCEFLLPHSCLPPSLQVNLFKFLHELLLPKLLGLFISEDIVILACVVLTQTPASNRQEAQLPLRNWASAMYFYVAKLLFIAIMNKFQYVTAVHVHGARSRLQ